MPCNKSVQIYIYLIVLTQGPGNANCFRRDTDFESALNNLALNDPLPYHATWSLSTAPE